MAGVGGRCCTGLDDVVPAVDDLVSDVLREVDLLFEGIRGAGARARPGAAEVPQVMVLQAPPPATDRQSRGKSEARRQGNHSAPKGRRRVAYGVDDGQVGLEHFLRHLLGEPLLDSFVGLVRHGAARVLFEGCLAHFDVKMMERSKMRKMREKDRNQLGSQCKSNGRG